MIRLDIEIVDLSVVGKSLALNMADHGFKVGGYNRSAAVTEQVMRDHPHKNLIPFYDLKDMTDALARPRKVILMIQADGPVDAVIEQLVPLLEKGDMILDGGNSFFEDARGRAALLAEKGIHYLGVDISGGEEDAQFGPFVMPGGNTDAYESVRPILEVIAARAMDEPCRAYIGPDGAGHYVKIVHNGIEYVDMQLITESYLLLKYVGGFNNQELARIFKSWNDGGLHSYLIGITTGISRGADDLGDGELIDHIRDNAKQKGTGKWTNVEALKQDADISMIISACTARIVSNHLDEREKTRQLIHSPAVGLSPDKESFAVMVRKALYTGKIIAYAQGFSLMQDISRLYGWNLDPGKIASIFRAGYIIQAVFSNDIAYAFEAESKPENLIFDGFFLSRINRHQNSLCQVVSTGVMNGLPVPALCGAMSYLDEFRAKAVGASLIQAQCNCFEAHTYERTDREGVFHHEWRQANDDQH